MSSCFSNVSIALSRIASVAALALGAFSLPAAAVSLCTAQGNCVTFDGTCVMDDGYACGSDDTGTHCYYGGTCYAHAVPQDVTSMAREFSQLGAPDRVVRQSVDRARVGAVVEEAARPTLRLRRATDQ